MTKKMKIALLVGLTMILLAATSVYAANLINKTLSGSIEVVTSSGGGAGTTSPPEPENITILTTLNFEDIPTISTTNLTGEIRVENNTGCDLYFVSAVATINSTDIGTLVVTSETTTVLAGDVHILEAEYRPIGGGMPLGNYTYEIELTYSY
jgi:hypothetical protein